MGQLLGVESPFQPDARSLLGLIISALIGAVATAAGVGGGAIYIPLFNVLVGFALKPSTALSQACITAGSLAAVATNLPRTHPSVAAAPLIDFPLMLMLTPLLLVGVGIGVLLNVALPSWLLNILLLVLLILLLSQAVAKGRALWVQETKRAQAATEAAARHDTDAESRASGAGVREALLPPGHHRSFDQPAIAPATSASAGPLGLRFRRGLAYTGTRGPVALEPDQEASFSCLEGLETDGAVGVSHETAAFGISGVTGGSSSVGPSRRRAVDLSWDCMEGVGVAGGAARCETPSSTSTMPLSSFAAAASKALPPMDVDEDLGAGPSQSGPRNAVSPRVLSPASSLMPAPSWRAFNELGALEFETDLEGDSDFEGAGTAGSVVGWHMRSTRTSGFGSGTASPALLPPTAQMLSLLLRRPLPAQLQMSPSTARGLRASIQRRGARRSSFDQATGADLPAAAAVEMDEETGPGGDSWLQRRSKWRSRFPPGALPHRGASGAALLPAHGYPGSSFLLPPVQQPPPSPGTALRASGSGVMRLRRRSQRDGGNDIDDGGEGLDEPLLGLQGEVVGQAGGASPDPRAEYGGAPAAPGAATAAGGDPGGGGFTAADPYRPTLRLATLHEESDDRVEGGTSGGGVGPRLARGGVELPSQLPFTGVSTTTDSSSQSLALPTSQLAGDWDPLRRSSPQPNNAASPALYVRHDGSGRTLVDVSPDVSVPRRESVGQSACIQIELFPDVEADRRRLGSWQGQADRVRRITAAAVRQWADEWAAALSRIPRRFACGLVGAWVVYLVLQGARAFQPQCSPSWWALFTIQIVSMLGISGVALVMAATALSKHAEAAVATASESRAEDKQGAPGQAENRSGTARWKQQQQQQQEQLERNERNKRVQGIHAVEPTLMIEPALEGTAALLVLRAPLTTFCATFGAGLTGGLLGLGGGMVMGPLLLQIGVQPQVTAASSGAMVLFSSSAALIQFALLHRLNGAYAGVFAAASLVAGVAGTHAVARAIKRSGRPSIVVLALAGVMGIGTVCVAIFGLHQAANQLRTGELGFAGICNISGGK
ncbi:hypothetical protein VaNZ11_011704 [Volvox africanus]|uniref:Uncharacterized protein n=1 Tax=Volvox africanus TaxID=51714 RepID=A0ABQ5SC52_9CHLO|nr:hypothetical protein VaNZ11_011704 [Volvox africanus]